MGFLAALIEHSFLQRAVATGLLASVSCGVVGSYVVARRITYVAGGIAHCLLAGLGAARYLQVTQGWEWLHPLYGALAVALVTAVLVGWVSLRWTEREDTVISALWAVGMAVGVLFIARTPGYSQDLMSYLFGNILMVSGEEVWLIGVLDVTVIVLAVAWHHQLTAVCYDPEFARLRGIRVEALYMLLLCLTALTVVVLVTAVGLVLVIALLALPAAAAGRFSRSLVHMMLGATGVTAVCSVGGIAASYSADLPAGATTILIAAASYVAAIAVGALHDRSLRRR